MQLTWDIAPTFVVGGLELRAYSVLFALAFIVGYALLRWQWLRKYDSRVALIEIGAGSIFAAIIGGRIAHVLFYQWNDFLADPGLMLRLGQGGLASHGTATGLVVWFAIVARLNRVPLFDAFDRGSFSGFFGAGLVRLGNFFNSEIVGRPTDQAWGVRFPYHDGADAPLRHPSQLYELVLLWLVAGILVMVDRRYGESRPQGLLTSLAFALYFTGRILLEPFKAPLVFSADSVVTMGMLLSLLPALLGWFGVWWTMFRARSAPE